MRVAFRVPDDGGELRQRVSSKDVGAERATMVRLAKWCTMPAPPGSKLPVSSAWRARVSLVIAPHRSRGGPVDELSALKRGPRH